MALLVPVLQIRWALTSARRQVENNARVGAFMLALRQLTQSFLLPETVTGLASSSYRLVSSWPALCGGAALLLLGPSWLASGGARRRWPACADGHFKDA